MKKRFNIVDVLAILFVCAVVVFVVFKFTSSTVLKSENDASKNVVYTVKISEIIESTVEAIPDSGKMYDEDGIEIGEIVSKKVVNAEVNKAMADGTYVKAVNPGKFDVYVDVSAKAVVEKEGYFINGKKNIGAGSTGSFKAKNIELWGYVTNIVEN